MARENPLLLGIDLGTSGTKAALVDDRGAVVASATAEHDVSSPHPGWSEQDPEWWWRSTVAAVRAATSSVQGDVVGIGLSGQMHGLVMVARDGRVLRPCILWNDQRSAPQCAKVERELGIETLVRLTGNRMLPGFTAPKILWCREHEPALEREAATHLLPKDWLRFRLSGVRATEVSDASGTALFDCAHRRWSDGMCEALGIRRDTLPACHESHVPSATLSDAAARELGLPSGIPIVGGAGDQAASALGTGITDEGPVSVTIGTSGVAFAASRSWRSAPDGEAHAFCHAVPERWHLMGVMLSCGGSLHWYRAQRGLSGDSGYERLAHEAASAAPGASGLTFLPYLTGERCPHVDPHARGALLGLDPSHRDSHIARSVFEGITFGLRDNLDLIRALGVHVAGVRLAGGGARSPFWAQLCADVFGVPVELGHGAEGGALGVALLAGVGVGVWPDAHAACAAALANTSPRVLAPVGPARYDGAYERFRHAYRALAPYFALQR
ncbi:MAG: xylulokinase [Phycisphaerae bacterium]|nr:xylulokinase [Phycisphaerae bacterium]